MPKDVATAAERALEKSIPARSAGISGESADAWLVSVNEKKHMRYRGWGETKVDSRFKCDTELTGKCL